MRFQDFFQKVIQLAEGLEDDKRTYTMIRQIEVKCLKSFPEPLPEWPKEWHKAGIQYAKHHFDYYGIEYPEGD